MLMLMANGWIYFGMKTPKTMHIRVNKIISYFYYTKNIMNYM